MIMPKINPEKTKQAQVICFCGRLLDILIREENLLIGAPLTNKCRCGVNWNIRVHLHTRAINVWPGEVPEARRASGG